MFFCCAMCKYPIRRFSNILQSYEYFFLVSPQIATCDAIPKDAVCDIIILFFFLLLILYVTVLKIKPPCIVAHVITDFHLSSEWFPICLRPSAIIYVFICRPVLIFLYERSIVYFKFSMSANINYPLC